MTKSQKNIMPDSRRDNAIRSRLWLWQNMWRFITLIWNFLQNCAYWFGGFRWNLYFLWINTIPSKHTQTSWSYWGTMLKRCRVGRTFCKCHNWCTSLHTKSCCIWLHHHDWPLRYIKNHSYNGGFRENIDELMEALDSNYLDGRVPLPHDYGNLSVGQG
jgi:hypothetical protein